MYLLSKYKCCFLKISRIVILQMVTPTFENTYGQFHINKDMTTIKKYFYFLINCMNNYSELFQLCWQQFFTCKSFFLSEWQQFKVRLQKILFFTAYFFEKGMFFFIILYARELYLQIASNKYINKLYENNKKGAQKQSNSMHIVHKGFQHLWHVA